jgi:hypothetical protein
MTKISLFVFSFAVGLLALPEKLFAADYTAPYLSYISASNITASGAKITWRTNEYSTTQVYYGTTTYVTARSAINYTRVLSHTVYLSGLLPNKTYYYRVKSKDAAGNSRLSSLHSFKTLALTPSPSPSPTPTLTPSPTPSPTPTASTKIPLTSANWTTQYDGYGFVTYDTATSSVVFAPKAATQPDETHAILLTSNKYMASPIKDFRVTITLKNEAQLRTPTPNAWECFWLFFNFNQTATTNAHTNYLVFKPNGVELGHAYGDIGQDYLYTKSSPQTPIGQTYTMVVEKRGGKLTAYLNGALVLSYDSASAALPLYDDPGTIALYTEDARVRVYSVDVQPL